MKELFVSTVKLAKEVVVKPSEACERVQRDGKAFPAAALIYFTYLLLEWLFYSWKPADFPSLGAAVSNGAAPGLREGMGAEFFSGLIFPFFWLLVFIAGLRLLKNGKLAFRILILAAATGAGALVLAFLNAARAGRGLYACLVILITGGACAYLRKNNFPWKPAAALLLSSNVLSVIFLPVMAAGVYAGSETVYLSAGIISALWVVFFTLRGLRAVTGISIARCAAASIFSFGLALVIMYSLYGAGLIGKTAVRAMMAI